MEDDKNNLNNQEFILETPFIIEEKISDENRIKYIRGKFLGKGAFAKCYELKNFYTNEIYAAKIFEKSLLSNPKSKKKLLNEINLHKMLRHKNIVNYEHFFEDSKNVYILLELCSNQTLNELVKRRKRLTEIEVQCYLIKIIKALKYIHEHKIIHRDLKLGNCFLTNKLELKLGDFGLSSRLEFEGQKRRTICGTPNYIAPEILDRRNGHSYEADIWSLGVLTYALLYGKLPFETDEVKWTYKKIKLNSYSFSENIKVHPSAKKLIIDILNLDPSKRPTLDQILQHEFFRIYTSIPAILPLSSLACPPSQAFISQYLRIEHIPSPRKIFDNSNKIVNRDASNILLRYNCLNKVNSLKSDDVILKNNIHEIDLSELEDCGAKYNSDIRIQKVDEKQNIDENINYNNENVLESFCCNESFKRISLNTRSPNSNFNFVSNKNIPSNENIVNQLMIFEYKISKYFDYIHKFGIVYFIFPLYIGLCFNDNCNILKEMSKYALDTYENNDNSCNKNVDYLYFYIDQDIKNVLNFDEDGLDKFLNDKNTEANIKKKFDIFKKVIQMKSQDFENSIIKNKFEYNKLPNKKQKIFFIKNVFKVQDAIMFRLSNKLIQICFFDQTELIMSTEYDEIFYISKNEGMFKESLKNVLKSNIPDLLKKVRYAKNLLIIFVKNQKK